MKFDKLEQDSLRFCAGEISRVAQDKGISLNEKMVLASVKTIIRGTSNEMLASMETEEEDTPVYNQAADLVAAAIHSALNGNMERSLKLFATVVAIEDAPTLVSALLSSNEAAMELRAEFDAPGELSNDFADHDDNEEDLDIIDNYSDDDASTMDKNAPLIDIGEQDDTYDAPEADQDANAADTYNSPEYLDVGPEVMNDGNLTIANLDEIVANIMESGEDADVGPGHADPIKDIKKRKEGGEFDKPNKRVILTKPHGRAKHLSENEVDESQNSDTSKEMDTEGEILAIMKDSRITNLAPDRRNKLIACVNTISASGTEEDRVNSLEFLKQALERL